MPEIVMLVHMAVLVLGVALEQPLQVVSTAAFIANRQAFS
jgi:hypothetical protein